MAENTSELARSVVDSWKNKMPEQLGLPKFDIPEMNTDKLNTNLSKSVSIKMPEQLRLPKFELPEINTEKLNNNLSKSFSVKVPENMQIPKLNIPRPDFMDNIPKLNSQKLDIQDMPTLTANLSQEIARPPQQANNTNNTYTDDHKRNITIKNVNMNMADLTQAQARRLFGQMLDSI